MTPRLRFPLTSSAIATFALLLSPLLHRASAGSPDAEWDQIKSKIRKDFPGVPEISTASLAQAIARGAAPVLIDSRSHSEFAVSHIPGALHATSVDEVKKVAPPDAEILVYCSVGYRSAKLVAALRKAGFTKVGNLDGSIFAWANEGRPLVRDGGQSATTVHPFSLRWGKLLAAPKRHPLPE